MKKLFIILFISVAFVCGGLTTYAYFYNKINYKPTIITNTVVSKSNDEIFTINKTNFDTYSKSLLQAMSKCTKDEKRLDIKSDHDLQTFLAFYHGQDFYNSSSKMSKEQKNVSDDVWMTSINLTYLLEAVQDNDSNKISTQHKILTDLLAKYNL